MKREKVERQVGEDTFDYGLLIGHEDAHKLIRDETADIFVTFPHMTIQEFLGSFWFVCRLCNGENLEAILGSDCETPVFLRNPLFLQFVLWFLQSSHEYFTFDRKQEAYDSLISYTTQLVDEESLNLRIIAALDERQIEAVMKCFGDVIAQYRKTRHLIRSVQLSISIPSEFDSFVLVVTIETDGTRNHPDATDILTSTANHWKRVALLELCLFKARLHWGSDKAPDSFGVATHFESESLGISGSVCVWLWTAEWQFSNKTVTKLPFGCSDSNCFVAKLPFGHSDTSSNAEWSIVIVDISGIGWVWTLMRSVHGP